MSRAKSLALLAGVGVAAVALYRSPDEADFKPDLQNAIEKGRTTAAYLLLGDRHQLLEIAKDDPDLKAKIENAGLRDFWEIRDRSGHILLDLDFPSWRVRPKIDVQITSPIWFAGVQSMELLELKRLGNLVVMTFAYTNFLDTIVEIPGKGRLLFTVGVRYFQPMDDRLAHRLIRKSANLPIVRNFVGRLGTTGRWVVFDFNYTYSLADYFDWVVAEGINYSQKSLEQFKQEFSAERFLDQMRRGLAFDIQWAYDEVGSQIDRIETLHKASEAETESGTTPVSP